MSKMTATEKILARAAGKESVRAGEIVTAKVDLCMGNELSTSLAIPVFKALGCKRVKDPSRVTIVMSHFAPNKDIMTAQLSQQVRDWARGWGIEHFYEAGKGGIEHVLLPDEGLIRPGEVIVGGDSHSVTYGAWNAFGIGIGSTDLACAMATGEIWLRVPETIRFNFKGKLKGWATAKDLILYAIARIGVAGANYCAVEFAGEAMDALDMPGRSTVCNMTAEMGGKNGIAKFDEKTRDFMRKTRLQVPDDAYQPVWADDDATWKEVYDLDVSELEPIVAFPSLPSNGRPISEVGDVKVDQVVIGSCTNGRIEDFRLAAEVLRGHKIADSVRMVVLPASQKVYMELAREGLLAQFAEAGAAVSTPTCGPCLGGHMGVLAKDEVCLSTTNRNFVGRMGHRDAKVYLGSPAVAAATAVAGKITSPEEITGQKAPTGRVAELVR
jgi:3-isopropylmalate/(R)-2-methylmalate dehydratase large subunit